MRLRFVVGFVVLQLLFGVCNGLGTRLGSKRSRLVCADLKQPGPCKAYFPRYYYDTATGTCKQFIYGGCTGNGNNFQTEADCIKRCIPTCYLPKETGPCRGFFPRWYFNRFTLSCQQFTYGGCRGNNNRFESQLKCNRACKRYFGANIIDEPSSSSLRQKVSA